MDLHLPVDHEQWPELRGLRAALGAAAATHLFLRLWVELGYAAQSGSPVGRVDERCRTLTLDHADVPDKAAAWAALVSPACGLLQAVDGGGWVCPLFGRHHAHLDPSHEPMHRRGWKTSLFVRQMAKYQRECLQQGLLIPSEVWKDDAGKALDHETVRRVLVLVRMLDNALERPERPHTAEGFPLTLVQMALRVLQEFPQEVIEETARRLLLFRRHPALPPTTEQLLPRFREVAENVSEKNQTTRML